MALIWPFEPQMRLGEVKLERYQQLVMSFGQSEEVTVVNLVEAYLRAEQDRLFLDHIHASPAGCEVAADAVFDSVARLVR